MIWNVIVHSTSYREWNGNEPDKTGALGKPGFSERTRKRGDILWKDSSKRKGGSKWIKINNLEKKKDTLNSFLLPTLTINIVHKGIWAEKGRTDSRCCLTLETSSTKWIGIRRDHIGTKSPFKKMWIKDIPLRKISYPPQKNPGSLGKV